MITYPENPFKKAYGTATVNTSQFKWETVRQEIDECLCDTGAILSDQQEAVGAADREKGEGSRGLGLAFSPSVSLCACSQWT